MTGFLNVAASMYYLRSVSKQKSASKKKTKKNANPYEQQILSAIDYACYRGYIDWRGAKELGETAEDMLEDAESAFEYGNYRQCMNIAIPVMIHMCHALDNADDSNGDIGDPIRMSFDLLMRIACSDDLDSATRNDLMKFCFEAFKNNTFGSYDWHLGMMEIASQLADSRKAADAIIELYRDCVYQRLEKGVGRNIYQEICSYLRHMKKLGRKDVVSETIADLRSKYPRRPALLDELDNV